MAKARLYLDVDGVVNAWHADRSWGDMSEGDAGPSGGGVFTIKWSPTMIEELKALDLEIVWLTTWRDYAEPLIGGLTGVGVGSRHIDPLDGYTTFPSIMWKTRALIQDQIDNPMPFVWADDEINLRQINVAKEHGSLALVIDENRGITPEHIQQIKAFLDSLPEADTGS